jgi:hypothetical protein
MREILLQWHDPASPLRSVPLPDTMGYSFSEHMGGVIDVYTLPTVYSIPTGYIHFCTSDGTLCKSPVVEDFQEQRNTARIPAAMRQSPALAENSATSARVFHFRVEKPCASISIPREIANMARSMGGIIFAAPYVYKNTDCTKRQKQTPTASA